MLKLLRMVLFVLVSISVIRPAEAQGARCWRNWTSAYSWESCSRVPCRTSLGTAPAPGTIAGPSWMLGRHLWVQGYGSGTVLDTGGARIQSGWFDLWFPSTGAALRWGKRRVLVCG